MNFYFVLSLTEAGLVVLRFSKALNVFLLYLFPLLGPSLELNLFLCTQGSLYQVNLDE